MYTQMLEYTYTHTCINIHERAQAAEVPRGEPRTGPWSPTAILVVIFSPLTSRAAPPNTPICTFEKNSPKLPKSVCTDGCVLLLLLLLRPGRGRPLSLHPGGEKHFSPF